MTSLTGTPVTLAAMAASMTCDQGEPLPPKPPPRKCEMTRMLDLGMPNTSDARRWTEKMPWVAS